MAGKRGFLRGQEDVDLASPDIVDKDGLGEPEGNRHLLTTFRGNCSTLKEDPEWIATTAIRTHEHAKNVQRRHSTSGQRRSVLAGDRRSKSA
jgi:hypothetical protein